MKKSDIRWLGELGVFKAEAVKIAVVISHPDQIDSRCQQGEQGAQDADKPWHAYFFFFLVFYCP